MTFTFKKTVEGTLMSIGVAKILESIFHILFHREDNGYHERKKTLLLEALAIVIVFILVLKFEF